MRYLVYFYQTHFLLLKIILTLFLHSSTHSSTHSSNTILFYNRVFGKLNNFYNLSNIYGAFFECWSSKEDIFWTNIYGHIFIWNKPKWCFLLNFLLIFAQNLTKKCKNMKKEILTGFLYVRHSNAGQNMQHKLHNAKKNVVMPSFLSNFIQIGIT